MLRRPHPVRRRGTATVELAFVMIFTVVPMIIGLWEMGRYVQVQQIVANSAREGARMAAQAVTIKSDGTQTLVVTNGAAGVPSVKSAVMQYLSGAGLTRLKYADVDVTFAWQPWDSATDPPLVGTPGTGEPYTGIQGQRFRVTVTITDESAPGVLKPVGSRPLREKVLWSTLELVKPNTVSYQVDWVMMVDRPFTINATVPTW
jgi:Flp pilus assembly protein TadG